MKENYIIAAFRETVAQRFPEQSVELNRLLDEKLSRLRGRLDTLGDPHVGIC